MLLLFSAASAAQELPNKIRGYKVHRAEISAGNGSTAGNGISFGLRFGEPEIGDIGFDGVTFRVAGSAYSEGQSGKVDFLTFKDFTVNGIPVEIREYRNAFRLVSGEETRLPEPLEIMVSIPSAIRGAAKELNDAPSEWEVTGTVFVFGRFRKYGFSFKRVVPLEVAFLVPNPLN